MGVTMRDTTIRMIRIHLQVDDSITPAERERLMRRLGAPTSSETPTPPTDRLLRRAEAGRMLGRSVKTVDRWASTGILRRIVVPSRRRAAGFLMSDLNALISARASSSAVGEP
jgi:hypothetical protein